MGQKLSPEQVELYKRVEEVLHYLWDPLGVSDTPEARDEYHRYASRVFSLLVNHSAEGAIADYLLDVALNEMGDGGTVNQKCRDRVAQIEKILRNWQDSIEERTDGTLRGTR